MENLLFNFNTQNTTKYFEYTGTKAFFTVDNFNLLSLADLITSRKMNLNAMSPFSFHVKGGINYKESCENPDSVFVSCFFF